jgi:hypothetical protein
MLPCVLCAGLRAAWTQGYVEAVPTATACSRDGRQADKQTDRRLHVRSNEHWRGWGANIIWVLIETEVCQYIVRSEHVAVWLG